MKAVIKFNSDSIMNITNSKRIRSINFTEKEVNILLRIVWRYRDIVEQKKIDGVTNKKKEIAWNKITQIFNRVSQDTHRSLKTLKFKYEGFKKTTKKKLQLYEQGEKVHFTKCEKTMISFCTYGDTNNSLAIEPIEKIKIEIDEGDIKHYLDNEQVFVTRIKEEIEEDNMEKMSDSEPEPIDKVNEEIDDTIKHYSDTDQDTLENRINKDSRVSKPDSKTKALAPTEIGKRNIEKNTSTKLVINETERNNHSFNGPRSKFRRNQHVASKYTRSRLELLELKKEIARKELEYKRIEHEFLIKQKRQEHRIRIRHLLREEARSQEFHEARILSLL